MDVGTQKRILKMFKAAKANKVVISKNGRSWTLPSLEDAIRYFSSISSLDESKIESMVRSREGYICGFRVSYQ